MNTKTEERRIAIKSERQQISDEITAVFSKIISEMGMDEPENFEKIAHYIIKDILETADIDKWSTGDVIIGFRRWIESRK